MRWCCARRARGGATASSAGTKASPPDAACYAVAMTSRFAFTCFLLLAACGGSTAPASSTAAPAPAPATTEAPPSAKGADAGSAPTAEECEASGGRVVYDIGDGAIHRPGYRCPGSGQPPIGPIRFEPGKPIPIEGAVCCR